MDSKHAIPVGYRIAAVLTSLIILCGAARHSYKHAPGSARPANRASSRRSIDPGELFSRRARRRAVTMLQLELLEMRKARLERVRDAIRRHIPIDQILKGNP
ncbi:MAG: hypothetical protein M3Y21_03485 [Candidatus Eremiobacteraeota bacterium]|nr:hypothetical protein [Candidatus Eremiobacteraeota bacterium]